MNDAKDYVTHKVHEMYWIDDPDHPPPMNKTLQLINEGGTLCKGKLTPENLTHFTHWLEMPRVPKVKKWLEAHANIPRPIPAPLGRSQTVCNGDDIQASSAPIGDSAADGKDVHQADKTANESAQSISILDAILSIPIGGNEA